MSYNTKNYTEQGGAKTVIGGTLEIKEGAVVTGMAADPLLAATAAALGGIKAAAAGAGDTVEVKIGAGSKLFVPAYPADAADATEEVAGVVKAAANQAASVATDATDLLADFNILLAALKAAGIMTDDAE